ncbi:MAG: 23S rRNA (guanosine(2251)-2'-O)-methyltransferase RlmB [Spirochaetota bacterium]|nr:23S rRNA (guanosine(2251)-2'-O)-methyltransferase RlmB [Spirochaetota bacterium]
MEKKEIVIGRNSVLEYIKELNNPSDAKLLISKSAHGKIINTIAENSKKKGIPIEYCEKEKLSKYCSSSKHQGVILQILMESHRLDENEFLNHVLLERGILVLLDQLTDPHNIGSIIRTAEALGAAGLVITKSRSTDINSTVIKTSSGATAHLRILTISNISNFIEKAKKIGFWIIGTGERGNAKLSLLKEMKPSIIIIGNEGKGIRRLTQEKCDIIAQIPLKGKISSLNASVAAGIILYEALKD